MTLPEQIYYIVQDEQIVGRYGADLNDALRHLQLFGKSKKGPNRAIIPILSNKTQATPLYSLHLPDEEVRLQISEYCYWENEQVLENMQRIVEREHQIMIAGNQTHQIRLSLFLFSPLFQDFEPETIRKACCSHFEGVYQQLQEMKIKVHSVEEEKGTNSDMDSNTMKRKRSCDDIHHQHTTKGATTKMSKTPERNQESADDQLVVDHTGSVSLAFD